MIVLKAYNNLHYVGEWVEKGNECVAVNLIKLAIVELFPTGRKFMTEIESKAK